jgi:hypothetical protein
MPDVEGEKWAAERLAEDLRAEGRMVSYEPVKPDPPDFAFDVDGERWAVEHPTGQLPGYWDWRRFLQSSPCLAAQ